MENKTILDNEKFLQMLINYVADTNPIKYKEIFNECMNCSIESVPAERASVEVKDELEEIFDELERDAYNVKYHTYDYKITNQIVRKHFEKLFKGQNEENVPARIREYGNKETNSR